MTNAWEEYKFHVVHLVEKIADNAIYIDRVDDKEKDMQYLFEYLNKKGREGWYYRHESRHTEIIYLEKRVGENVKYEYQIIHCVEDYTDGPLIVQRVNDHKLHKHILMTDYLNEMGKKGFYLRGELKHQFCNIIERKKK